MPPLSLASLAHAAAHRWHLAGSVAREAPATVPKCAALVPADRGRRGRSRKYWPTDITEVNTRYQMEATASSGICL